MSKLINKFYCLIIILSIVALVNGCASVPLLHGAKDVVISNEPQPEDCQFMGTVSIADINHFNWVYARVNPLHKMIINNLRNQALALEANFIELSGYDDDGFLLPVYNNAVTGYAYYCPDIPSKPPEQLIKMHFYLNTPYAVDKDI